MMIEGELFKEGVCSLLLKCLSRTEGQELMKEIHLGICGAQIGSRPLLGKVFRQGFTDQKLLWMQQIWYRNVTIARDVPETKSNFFSNPINSAYLATIEVGNGFIGTITTSSGNL
jgi:hypothetical protein